MNIKEIALPLINKLVPEHSPSLRELILQFAEALVAELAKENDLEAELESLRKDAERYRWLRENNWFKHEIVVIAPYERTAHETDVYLDKAIDAAIAAEPMDKIARDCTSGYEAALLGIAELTRQRDLAVSALKQSREALRLPCDRWNKTQFEIVQSAIASIDSAIKEGEV